MTLLSHLIATYITETTFPEVDSLQLLPSPCSSLPTTQRRSQPLPEHPQPHQHLHPPLGASQAPPQQLFLMVSVLSNSFMNNFLPFSQAMVNNGTYNSFLGPQQPCSAMVLVMLTVHGYCSFQLGEMLPHPPTVSHPIIAPIGLSNSRSTEGLVCHHFCSQFKTIN